MDSSDNQAKLFRDTKSLLSQPRSFTVPPGSDVVSLANEVGDFFADKVSQMRASLDGNSGAVDDDSLEDGNFSVLLEKFNTSSPEDVRGLTCRAAKKSCPLDPLPTTLVTQCLDELTPVLNAMINTSLQSAHFAEKWKEALVTPLVKKAGLDQTKANLRPVSNLAYVSKLTESAAATQLEKHLLENVLYPLHPSSYQKHHSTDTALLKVYNDILLNMNSQQVTLLVLLDFSAAFDTVNHSMLLRVVRSKLGLGGYCPCVAWLFGSYLSDRSQPIILDCTRSRTYQRNLKVPQDSCLGPLLFDIYVSGLFDIVINHAPVGVHAYADVFQVYLSFSPSSCVNEEQAVQVIQDCVADIKSWARQHSLMLKVAPYGYSLFVLRALVSTILGNLPITLSCTSLEPIEIKFWEIKLPF